MRKLSDSSILIIIGIVIFLLGCIQPSRYENAKENGYEVDARIVDVEEELEAQRQELWYMEEAKRIEEENYRAQWGYDPTDDDEDDSNDKRMKGIRIK